MNKPIAIHPQVVERRRDLCRSLVGRVQWIGEDGPDRAGRPWVGFYAVPIDYDPVADTFRIGWQQSIPAGRVEPVMVYDAVWRLLVELNSGIDVGAADVSSSTPAGRPITQLPCP